MNFKTFIVFNATTKQQYTVNAFSWVRAVQAALAVNDGTTAEDWTAQDLGDYNPVIRQRLINESVKL